MSAKQSCLREEREERREQPEKKIRSKGIQDYVRVVFMYFNKKAVAIVPRWYSLDALEDYIKKSFGFESESIFKFKFMFREKEISIFSSPMHIIDKEDCYLPITVMINKNYVPRKMSLFDPSESEDDFEKVEPPKKDEEGEKRLREECPELYIVPDFMKDADEETD